MMDELWLAFEGGGTKTRLLLARPEGEILASETGGCSNGYYIDPVRYPREMGALLKRLKKAADRAGGRVTAAGLAGPLNAALVKEVVGRVFDGVGFIEAGEAEIALACRGLRVGLTLIAGTGSNCTAYNEHGQHTVSGGFGPQFDDVGSAYWIGCEAVAAVVRARDGRGPATALRARLLAYAGIQDLWELLRLCDRNGHVSRPYIAGFAPEVFAAAADGDATARAIGREAGRQLAGLVAAAARRADICTRPIPLVPSGGVFHGVKWILPALKRGLRASGLEFDILPPVLEPAPGIFAILARKLDWRQAGVP